MSNLIVINTSFNPWYNLALEEYLLDKVTDYDNILFLWQNANTVVIGRNQNAWRECRTELLESEGGKLARRSTGGGAVYHDAGNLNFSFILPRSSQDFLIQAGIITKAVGKFGINAYVNGRNDIVTDQGKFSGNAFTYRKNRALHLPGGIEISTAFQSGQRRGASCAKTRIQTGNMAKSNCNTRVPTCMSCFRHSCILIFSPYSLITELLLLPPYE